MEKKKYGLVLIVSFIILITCSRFEKMMMVESGTPEEILTNSAKVTGFIIDKGGGRVTVGHCYDRNPGVTISNPKTEIKSLDNSRNFISELASLEAETKYYTKAYISDGEFVVYGKEISFITLPSTVPKITTTGISDITQTSCMSGGTITDEGGVPVTSRGVCWDTDEEPEITDNETLNGEGAGNFSSQITGLTGNTKYYVRAYATNAKGTGYGNQLSFITSPVIPILSTADPFPVTLSTAACGGKILNDGGATVTSRGVCWNTTGMPKISDKKTTDGQGSGTFMSILTGLKPDSLYHIRAYATNIAGTAYGAEKVLLTDPATIIDVEGNIYTTVRIGTQLWMKENLKTTRYNDGNLIPPVTDSAVWINLVTHAYCWYKNNPSAYMHTYGALYNWYAVNSGKLCPAGWHVPIDAEWTILTNFLGGEIVAGGKMKETGFAHWSSPNTGATNESQFTGLAGGARGASAVYDNMGNYGYWWTKTTSLDPAYAWGRVLQFDSAEILRRDYYYKKNGFSVRCLRD